MQMFLIELAGRRLAQGGYVDHRRRDLTIRPTKLQGATTAEIDSFGAHLSFGKKCVRHGRRPVIFLVDERQSHHLQVPADDRHASVKSRGPNSMPKRTGASRSSV